jgi:hypothetical protein
MSIHSQWLSEEFQNDVIFEESREIRKEQADKQAMKQVDRTIEMFNEINALFGYTRK